MTERERAELRDLIDRRRREVEGVEYDTRIHGRESTYVDGCRCGECRWVANEARARRRRNAKSLPYNGDKTHCIHGHAFDAVNTYVNKHGHRVCRACRREYMRGYVASRRLAEVEVPAA